MSNLLFSLTNFQFAEMCLAHQVVGKEGKVEMDDQKSFKPTKGDTSAACHIVISQLLILQRQYEMAKEYLLKVVKEEKEVRNSVFKCQPCYNELVAENC